MRLCLAGDVMTGRGIDQVLPYSAPPELYEPYVRSARVYVALAERANGPIPKPVSLDYLWGDALAEIDRRRPDAVIVNLETAVTSRGSPWRRKSIHYRMHPRNMPCLTAARIDCCVLANNHVLDWGYEGLEDTLESLHAAGIHTAGAGRDAEQARAPAVLERPGGSRVLVFAYAMQTAGVPPDWAAARGPGINFLASLSIDVVGKHVQSAKRDGDTVVVSLHWGDNWGYEVSQAERDFARGLVEAGVDVVHGHSSHHPKPVELHRGRPILYGCGDLINDYEGIGGHESYLPGLAVLYFFTPGAALELVPFRVRRFRLERAGEDDIAWLAQKLGLQIREGALIA
ncbi:MAG TPA: CapA family protein [Burkholderiales bacterium]|nr:CapA family protein [Burkholderiales bacterium]